MDISGCVDDIAIAVYGVAPRNIINYKYPKEVSNPYYMMKYKPNYSKQNEMGYVCEKL